MIRACSEGDVASGRKTGSRPILWISLVVAAACGACDREPQAAPQRNPSSQRIISMSPSTTEIICAMGLRSRLVGVSTACDFPPEVKALPKVGMLGTPNIEKALSLRPDLLVSTRFQKKHHRRRLADLGIPLCVIPYGNMAELYDAIGKIGEATAQPVAAAKLAADMKQREQKVVKAAGAIPPRSGRACTSRSAITRSTR